MLTQAVSFRRYPARVIAWPLVPHIITLDRDAYHNWGSEAAPGMYYVLLRRPSTGYHYQG